MKQLRTLIRARRRGLAQASDGVAALEFAVIGPAFFLMLMVILDLGHMAYSNAVLNGAVQDAARRSTLEGANTTTADNYVKQSIKGIMPGAVLTSTRVSYYDFNDIGRPERLNDTNTNGRCDPGETYTDENRNGNWDADVGSNGNGSANDVVVYTVTVSYDPLFRNPFMPESWTTRSMTASAVKKNQPFTNQQSYGSQSRTC